MSLPVPRRLTRAVRVIEDVTASRWDDYVASHADATGYHLHAWRGVIERVFGHETIYLAAEEDDRLRGVLPLFGAQRLKPLGKLVGVGLQAFLSLRAILPVLARQDPFDGRVAEPGELHEPPRLGDHPMLVFVYGGLSRPQNLGELPLAEARPLADLFDPLAHIHLVQAIHRGLASGR